MKHADSWIPTKAERNGTRWRASRNSKEVDIGSRFTADLLIQAYEHAIRTHARGVLADVGCGKMPYYGIYRDLVTEAIGVDWPASVHDSRHVDVLCDLNERIELADATVDTVLCTDVFEHIYRPAILWAEIARILRGSGVAIVATPFLYRIHEAPYDYHRYTRFALERYVGDSGLEIRSLTPIGGAPHVLTDIVCKVTQKGPLLSDAFRLAANGALSIRPLRAAAERTADGFPLAYLVTASKP